MVKIVLNMGLPSDDVALLGPERPRGREVAEPAFVLDEAAAGLLPIRAGEAGSDVLERVPPGFRDPVGGCFERDAARGAEFGVEGCVQGVALEYFLIRIANCTSLTSEAC